MDLQKATLYEVNLRQFSPSGSIREFIPHLQRLADLGVGILWIMPVQPTGERHRKGSLGSYYSVKDYLSVDPAYGSMEEFRELVDQAHHHGMKVILDWVANHTAWDNALTLIHPDFYSRDASGAFHPPFPEWEDVIQLDYSNMVLRSSMTRMMSEWVLRTGIDGFRCDMANLVPADFWEAAILELRQIKPLIFLAEAEDRHLLDAGFDAIYNWNFLHYLNSLVKGEDNAARLDTMLQSDILSFPPDKQSLLFTSNHDENSWNGSAIERIGAALEPATVLSFTLPGLPLIYNGQEAGMGKRLSFFDKDLIPWKPDKMASLYTLLTTLRNEHPALWSGKQSGSFRRLTNSSNHHVFSFIREKGDKAVWVMLNLSWEAQEVAIYSYISGNQYYDISTRLTVFPAPGARWHLGPWEYKILVK